MMGSGKSTVGRRLAAEYDADFVDLDVRVERLFGERISDMLGGPTADAQKFRARERDGLLSLLAEPGFAGRPVVVATGGGVVIDPRNRARMRAVGTVVHLRVAVDVLASRLRADIAEDPGARPLLQPAVVDLASRLLELASARQGAYDDCDFVVEGTGDPDEVIARIVEVLGLGGPSAEHEAV
jgi:shikimate kinase